MAVLHLEAVCQSAQVSHRKTIFIILYYYYLCYLLLLYIFRLLTSFHIWTLTLKNVKPEANLDFFVFLFFLQEESIEEVIKDTESLFKSREKEYQDTIDQIEVRRSGAVGPAAVNVDVLNKGRRTVSWRQLSYL